MQKLWSAFAPVWLAWLLLKAFWALGLSACRTASSCSLCLFQNRQQNKTFKKGTELVYKHARVRIHISSGVLTCIARFAHHVWFLVKKNGWARRSCKEPEIGNIMNNSQMLGCGVRPFIKSTTSSFFSGREQNIFPRSELSAFITCGVVYTTLQ